VRPPLLAGAGEVAGEGPDGLILGAPAYMAPEQADPSWREQLDVRTDVYSLGGILFEILYDIPPNGEGHAPSAIRTALAARKGLPARGTFGPWAARSPKLARKLEPVCLRALESDPGARQASVSAFIEEIEQCATESAG
jgi:eukaryotic-like serine/threonine-protein kinase